MEFTILYLCEGGNPKAYSGSKGKYTVSCTLKCQEWSYSLFELCSENKVGGGFKDACNTEIPTLTYKPVTEV